MVERNPLTVKRAKSIEDIFQQVKDYDLVLTVDAPLADALNARLERPQLGHFATTPRRLALNEISSDKKIFRDKRELFLKIMEDTDVDEKRTTYLLERIVECWKETGDPSKIFQQKTTPKDDTKKILKILRETINPYTAVEKYIVEQEKKLAVISEYQFSTLDKKILPEKYDNIEVFSDTEKEISPFHIFNSTTEIVQTVLDNLKDIDSRDAAIVMKKDSEYRYLIEALFNSNDIPYMVSKELKEHEDIRRLLNLIKASFFREGLKVKDVKPLVSQGSIIDPKTEEYLLKFYSDEDLDHFKRILEEIPEITFRELLEKNLFQDKTEDIKRHLDDLNILEKQITPERMRSLIHYLESFDIEIKSAGQGVLIASPNSSTFIDRPYVFYLGMGTSWTPEPPNNPWIDKKDFDEEKKKDFEILLQNGEEQYYLVKNREMGQKIVPSFYLNEFCDEEISSFKDLKHELNKKDLHEPLSPFPKIDINTDPKPIKTISQSTLNTLVRCPKDQFFSEFVKTPDRVYFRRGTILHDFAEFSLNYPELCQDLDFMVEKVMNKMKPFLEEHEVSEAKTRFKIGMKNLRSFLEDQKAQLEEPEGYEKIDKDNIFSDLFSKPINSKYTEVSFHNKSIGAKGKVDLILDEDHIVDHKSSSKNSIYSIMRKSDIKNIDERPDFQAKMYLAHHRQYHTGDPIRFTYYHLLNNLRDVISGESDFKDNKVTIEYHPKDFNEVTQKREMYEWLKSSNRRKKVLEKLGYKNYKRFFKKRTILETDKDEILENEITTEFTKYCKEKIGSYKYVERACKGILKKLIVFRKTHYFKEDLDRFEDFLKDKIEEYKRYRTSNFPVGDTDPENIENKDLVIPEEGRP